MNIMIREGGITNMVLVVQWDEVGDATEYSVCMSLCAEIEAKRSKTNIQCL